MSGVLERNLDALGKVIPALAPQIENTPVPEGFARTAGADGTGTFARVISGPEARRIVWLGGTSMPRASAAPIASALNAFSNGANGLGLTIGTGYEWLAFLAKLPAPQMVYVFEPDPANLRMALEICDLAAPLATRRLVLLPTEPKAAADWLVAFLGQNIGFEPPTVLHPPPTLAGPRKNELLAAGEAIVRRAVLARQEHTVAVREKIVTLMQRSAPADIRLAFLLSPRYPLERPIGAAAAAGDTTLFIDRHDSASTLLRMERLAAQLKSPPVGARAIGLSAGGKILSDLFREQLATVPPGVPVETWVPPVVGPAYWDRIPPAATLAAEDRIVVHHGHHAELLQSRGIAAQQIEIRPLYPPATFAPAGAPAFALRHRVALFADLPPMDADALAIQLPTHQAVFAAARELIAADFLTVHPGMTADLLRRALSRAGVDPRTEDPALREPMLRIIRDVLIPHLPAVCLAEALAAQDVPLLLLGDWSGAELPAQTSKVVPFTGYSPACWQEVAAFAHLSPTGAVPPFLWEAVAAGICIAAPQHPADAQAGAITALLAPGDDFAHGPPAAYLSTLKQLLRDATRRDRLAAGALKSARSHIKI